jgi:hypothetical protein
MKCCIGPERLNLGKERMRRWPEAAEPGEA